MSDNTDSVVSDQDTGSSPLDDYGNGYDISITSDTRNLPLDEIERG